MEQVCLVERADTLTQLPISVTTLVFRSIENFMHIHSYVHLSFVITGDATGNIDGKDYSFPAGSCIVCAPFLPHSFKTTGSDDTPIVVHMRFRPSFLTEYGYPFFFRGKSLRLGDRLILNSRQFTDEEKTEATSIIRAITAEFEKKRSTSYDKLAEQLVQLLLMMSTEASEEASPMSVETQRCIVKAVNYIEGNIAQKLSIDDMLPIAAMSRSLFTRQFKAITGMTFTNYITGVRLGSAMSKIITSEMTLNEIAALTGLYNKTNLVRVFTSRFGMPPMKFREYYEMLSPGTMERHRMYQKRWKWLDE